MAKPVDFVGGELRRRTSKNTQLINILQRKSGADAVEIGEVFGWKVHTTRAAISRLRRLGYVIETWVQAPRKTTRYRLAADAAICETVEIADGAAIPCITSPNQMQEPADAA